MANPETDLDNLANRYRRRVERELKAVIRKARDRRYAAALYTGALRFYLVLHLNNPFLGEVDELRRFAHRMGMGIDELMEQVRHLREKHKMLMAQESKEKEYRNTLDIIQSLTPADYLFQNVDSSLPIYSLPESIVVHEALSPYAFMPDFIEKDDDRMVIKFIVRITAMTEVIDRVSEEYDLTMENIAAILSPDEKPTVKSNETNPKGNPETTETQSPARETMNGSPESNGHEVMNVEQAATYLNMAVQTLYEKTSKKLIPHSKPYGKLLFRKSDLDQWIKEGRVYTQKDVEQLANQKMREFDERKKRKRGY